MRPPQFTGINPDQSWIDDDSMTLFLAITTDGISVSFPCDATFLKK